MGPDHQQEEEEMEVEVEVEEEVAPPEPVPVSVEAPLEVGRSQVGGKKANALFETLPSNLRQLTKTAPVKPSPLRQVQRVDTPSSPSESSTNGDLGKSASGRLNRSTKTADFMLDIIKEEDGKNKLSKIANPYAADSQVLARVTRQSAKAGSKKPEKAKNLVPVKKPDPVPEKKKETAEELLARTMPKEYRGKERKSEPATVAKKAEPASIPKKTEPVKPPASVPRTTSKTQLPDIPVSLFAPLESHKKDVAPPSAKPQPTLQSKSSSPVVVLDDSEGDEEMEVDVTSSPPKSMVRRQATPAKKRTQVLPVEDDDEEEEEAEGEEEERNGDEDYEEEEGDDTIAAYPRSAVEEEEEDELDADIEEVAPPTPKSKKASRSISIEPAERKNAVAPSTKPTTTKEPPRFNFGASKGTTQETMAPAAAKPFSFNPPTTSSTSSTKSNSPNPVPTTATFAFKPPSSSVPFGASSTATAIPFGASSTTSSFGGSSIFGKTPDPAPAAMEKKAEVPGSAFASNFGSSAFSSAGQTFGAKTTPAFSFGSSSTDKTLTPASSTLPSSTFAFGKSNTTASTMSAHPDSLSEDEARKKVFSMQAGELRKFDFSSAALPGVGALFGKSGEDRLDKEAREEVKGMRVEELPVFRFS
ncbi:hypothetical protein BT69DRAFT_1278354 [Atractiella rhizophila]|nr:hypothetical protein BT69DRAFT_1278354 [Atractiella rhizophila]